jgi:sulfite reductase alpha subunit-like flavoprotein
MHSFEKYGFTIVDPHSVGQQFCTHVRREREQFGRECPAQWSWIGGLTGPTNPTWHLEMRDFLVKPQYDYCADGMLLHTSTDAMKYAGASTSTSESSLGEPSTILDDGQRINKSVPRVLIAYGSETGQAEAVARRFRRQLKVLKPLLMSLNEVAGLDIISRQNISHLICICSTFGKGKPPSNSDKFFETDIANTSSAKYSVLALGSSLYPDFCHAGISLDKKLSESGMEACVKIAIADAASGADGVITDWLANVKNHILPRSLESELLVFQSTLSDEPPTNAFVWEPAEPTVGDGSPVVDAKALCVSNCEVIPSDPKEWREVRKVTFQVPAGSSYQTGDHLSVQPMNSDAMVRRFLSCFEKELIGYTQKAVNQNKMAEGDSILDIIKYVVVNSPCDTDAAMELQCKQPFRVECVEGEQRRSADVFFDTPTCLFDVVKSQLDLSVSPKDIVELLKLLEACLNKMLDSLGKDKVDALEHPLVEEFIGLSSPILAGSSEEKTGLIDSLIAQFPTLVNFLEHFKELFLEDFIAANFGRQAVAPALKLPEILVIMSRLQPRFYSISSSQQTSPNEVAITVGVLKATTSQHVKIEGVCSHFLAGLQPGVDRAKVVVVKSSFRLPESRDAPLLMVGAGTGLSPMIGFLEDRALDAKNGHGIGEINLFFGCRTEKDFIYEKTIRKYERKGMLNLHLGLSRSLKSPKKYVQDRITEMGKAASDLLMNESTHYYVCGDGRMAASCHEACVELLRKHQTMSRIKAVRHLRDMRAEGRWQTDVWGIVSHFEESKKTVTANKKIAAKIWLTHFRDDE